MGRRKREPMSEGKKNIIAGLLQEYDIKTAKDIEDAFCIRRSTVSKVIRLMEEKGFIERQSVDYDARLKKLVLTPEGEHIHHLIEEEVCKTEALLRQDISEEELETFFQVMEKFKKNIQ